MNDRPTTQDFANKLALLWRETLNGADPDFLDLSDKSACHAHHLKIQSIINELVDMFDGRGCDD